MGSADGFSWLYFAGRNRSLTGDYCQALMTDNVDEHFGPLRKDELLPPKAMTSAPTQRQLPCPQ